jgi:TonB family protein
MKKLILLLLFIPLVSFGQNKNSVLDCDINDNSCFQTLVNQHVLDNFNYPELGSYFNVQAMVYVDYTIDTNGVVGNISSKAALIGVVFEDVESKNIISVVFEKAANLIIENLPQINLSINDDVAESKKFRTPILYRLIDVEKGLTNSININKINQGIDFLNNLNQDELLSSVADPFEIIDEFPVFPGCEDLKESKKRLCFQYQINEHIRRNFRYPEIAQEKGIQGRVLVQFVLGKDGRVRGLSSSGTTSPALKQEAEIIISLLPKIKPAKKNGLRVVVPFSIPITFKIG